MHISLTEFYTIAKRCGYEVFTDDNTFYHLYYKNDNKMCKQMGRYWNATYSDKEATLYEPVKYNYFTPDTCKSKIYKDPKEFEADLLKNTFTMKKYFFDYYKRLNDRSI